MKKIISILILFLASSTFAKGSGINSYRCAEGFLVRYAEKGSILLSHRQKLASNIPLNSVAANKTARIGLYIYESANRKYSFQIQSDNENEAHLVIRSGKGRKVLNCDPNF